MGHHPLARIRSDAVVLSLLAVGVVFVGIYAGALLVWLLGIPSSSLWYSILLELTAAIAATACVGLLGGRWLLAPSVRDAKETLRLGWWCLVVSVGVMAFEAISWQLEGDPLPADWPSRLAQISLFCLLVGIFEETLFRGLIFQGLLAWLGGSRRGVVMATLVTSVLFGLIHLDFRVAFASSLTVAQAVLKAVETGMFSFLLCVIFLSTRRLVGICLLHGLSDLLILLPSFVLYGQPFEAEYVTTSPDAPYTIALYLLVIALYLPFTIKAARELRRGAHVTYGAFVEHAAQARAVTVAVQDSPARTPPPPSGLRPGAGETWDA